MNYKRYIIAYTLLVLFVSSVQAMEQKAVTLNVEVGGKSYSLTHEQVAQSEVLKNLLKKHGESEEPLVVPGKISKDVFDYLYKDLTDQEYDENDLDDGLLNAMFLAAVELKIPRLREKYTDITTNRLTDVTLEVGDKEYVMNVAQAKRSKTLKNLLEDVEDYATPIPLDTLTADVFDYVYMDLTNTPYDAASVSDEMLVDLINAANYFDVEKLLQKYQELFLKRLKRIETEEQLESRLDLIQRLPEEMQEFLSQSLCAESLAFFNKLPQSTIQELPEREYQGYKVTMSPDKKKMVIYNLNELSYMIDLVTNKRLWQKDFLNYEYHFSSDSSQLFLWSPNGMKLLDVQTGEEVWNNVLVTSKELVIDGFFSDVSKIVIHFLKTVMILDSNSGKVLYQQQEVFDNFWGINNCYYDPETHYLTIDSKSHLEVVVIDSITGKIVKNKKVEIPNSIFSSPDNLFTSPDGKKIIIVSKESVMVENSANEEGNFSWAFKKPMRIMPRVRSFSKDNSLFSLASELDKVVFVLNMVTGESVWAGEGLHLDGNNILFSPNAEMLLIKNKDEDVIIIDLQKKKKIESRIVRQRFIENTIHICFISDSMIAFLFLTEGLKINIKFYDKELEKIILSYQEAIGSGSFDFMGQKDNYLYIRNLRYSKKEFSEKELCFDISALAIFSFFNRPYVSLNQALVAYYNFKMIQNNKAIRLPLGLARESFGDLPQEIKVLVTNHNKQFKTLKSLNEDSIPGTALLGL